MGSGRELSHVVAAGLSSQSFCVVQCGQAEEKRRQRRNGLFVLQQVCAILSLMEMQRTISLAAF